MTDRRTPPLYIFDDLPEAYGRRMLGLGRETPSWSRTDALRRAEQQGRARKRRQHSDRHDKGRNETEGEAP
jgi:hypothetical protein